MNGISDLDISTIVGSLYRRKGMIVAVFFVVSLLVTYMAYSLPEIYRSSTLILVTPQRVPSAFVTSTVTMDLGERMRTIAQEILSRTRLEKIIQEFDLYAGSPTATSLEDRVEKLRKMIKIDSRRNNVFELAFESENPEKAKQVAGRLGSLFIEQNLQVREQQAIGTKSFINAEADRLRKELEEQESVVNQYKAANRFELPDQLDTNLRSVEQFRREMEGISQRLAALQERKGVLQKQIVEADILSVDLLGGLLATPGDVSTQNVQLQIKKKELESLLQRYSDKHPDVVRVKKEIHALEAENEDGASKPANSVQGPKVNPLKQVLQTQITDIDSEIQSFRSQHERIRAHMSALQGRVDNTPIRAIELSKISRGYEITLRKYQDLLAKGLESELAENMERKQKGEQFQITDPANLPLKPVRPNRPMMMLLGLLGGLVSGIALAVVWDNLDTSFKRSDELDGYADVPLLATIPALLTRGSVLEQRRAQGILIFASVGALAVGLACIRIFGPMYF